MSLITDDILMELWGKARAQSSDEWAAAKLWVHLWNKHLFSEKYWVLSPETLEGSGSRRVDTTIEHLGDNQLAVFAFHETKVSNTRPQEVEEAEKQAFTACIKYLGEHPDLQFVYAFTSFGTKGRAWRCAREDNYLSPIFGQYIEVHSSEARLIRQAVQMMRAVPPDRY